MKTSRFPACLFGKLANSFVTLAFVTILPMIFSAFSDEMSVAQAQDSFGISSIDVSGNKRVSSNTVISIAGISEGTALTPTQINGVVQNLYASGLFESVDVIPERGRLIIEVEEYPTINEISIEGNRRLKDEDLVSLIGSKPRRAYSPLQAEIDTLAITNAYAAAGRLAARVEPKIIRRSDNRVDLIFEVREGRVVEVNRIGFTGNRIYSDRRLRSAIASKQAGLLRAFVEKDTFIPERLEFDKDKLRNFYFKRGYIDANVSSASAEFARERNSLVVNFQVQEGQQYRFGILSITSAETDINTDDYAKIMSLKTGDVYNPDRVNKILERIDVMSSQKDLPFVQAKPVMVRNQDILTVDIEFQLIRGPKIFIERIDIEGNSDTLDRVIRREFDSVEGDPFNARKVQEAADRIRALGYFESVDVQTREGSSSNQIVIDVNVKEQATGTLSFGLGFSTDSGIGTNIKLTENNFLGRGQSVSFAFGTTPDNREFLLSFTEPKLLDRDLSLGFSLSYETTDDDGLMYNTRRSQFRPSLSFPIGEYSRLTPSILIESSRITSDAGSSPLIAAENASLSTLGVGLGYSYDKRNSPVNPTAGFVFGMDQTVAGLAGQNKYFKSVANAKVYKSFMNEAVILTAELEGGYLKSLGSGTTSINERFQLGGNTLRGFEAFGLGPRVVGPDPATPGANFNEALGGNFYALARVEASFPIGLPEEYGMHGGLFFDAGSVWGLGRTTATSGGTTVNASSSDFNLRSAFGLSIFWDTALGPLRFNFAKPLDYVASVDRTQSFNLTVDTRF